MKLLGTFAKPNRAGAEWPCAVVKIDRPAALGQQARTAFVAAYFNEGMELCASLIQDVPSRFLGSPGGPDGVLNGDQPPKRKAVRKKSAAVDRPRRVRAG